MCSRIAGSGKTVCLCALGAANKAHRSSCRRDSMLMELNETTHKRLKSSFSAELLNGLGCWATWAKSCARPPMFFEREKKVDRETIWLYRATVLMEWYQNCNSSMKSSQKSCRAFIGSGWMDGYYMRDRRRQASADKKTCGSFATIWLN